MSTETLIRPRPQAALDAPPATQARPAASKDGPLKVPRWMYGYGLFQGSAVSGDSLTLLWGAAVLGMSPAMVGLLDAVGSIAFALGILALVFLVPRMSHSNNLFIFSVVGVGLTLALFATVSSTLLALTLAVLFGLLLAPSTALAPIMASSGVPRSRWSEAFSHLNRVSSLGGAIGMAAAAVWLAAAGRFGPPDMSIRLLFGIIGAVAVVGAMYSRRCLATAGKHQSAVTQRDASLMLSTKISGFYGVARRPLPLLSDQLVYYLLFSFILFAGMGMSFSGLHTYLVRDLRAPLALAMGAVLGFKVTSYLVSRPFSHGMAQLLPLQIQGVASLVRGAAIVGVAAVGFFLPANLALPLVLPLVAIWGISGGALAVAGAEATAQLAVPGRWKESMVLYMAVGNAGGIVGASLGGWLASLLGGFEIVFLIAAGLVLVGAALLFRN
ncbi:MAG: MFS transporter [Chloroflexi bacterium]|nr:MFS transporter [Chloroflexota bacterium]